MNPINKPKSAISIFCVLAAATIAVIVWSSHRTNSSQTSRNPVPPVERLRAFSMTNAPTASPAESMSSRPTNPGQALVMQKIAAVARAQSTIEPGQHSVIGFRTAEQAKSLRKLQDRVGDSLKVYLRAENGTPNQLKGHPLARAVAVTKGQNADSRDESTARGFLRDNAALLLLDDPDRELQLSNQQADDLGGSILRFNQSFQGLTVWPAEIGVRLNGSGEVDLVDCAYIPTPNGITVQPKLTSNEAEAKARASVTNGARSRINSPELVIYAPLDQPPKLAWKMNASGSVTEAWWILVDAKNGDTLATISRVMDGSVPGSGSDLLGTTRSLVVYQAGTTFYMLDASKPMFNALTGEGYIQVYDARGTNIDEYEGAFFVISSSAFSWPIADAVSASYNLGQTYDFYMQRFGRNSYNDAGSNLNASVRIGNYANASWNGELKMMLFGNSDRYAGSLDVIGHEVTHGVVSSIAGRGVLLYQNQSGALNESFADIFGEMIEARTDGTNDWLIGSHLSRVIRNMANPAAYGQPATMSQFLTTTSDHGGVHINSGIINRAYYLLANGLKGAIGNADAERIFYRCLTVSMKPFSQFVDARVGCVAAAETLFGIGSQQALKTAEAFDAVELYASPVSAPQPSNVNAAVDAQDSGMFIREHWFFTRDDLFRLEAAQGDPSTGSSLVTTVELSRPTITGDGAGMFFIGGDENLYAIKTTGSGFTNLSLGGLVHSVAVSPQGRYAAVVFNAAANVRTNQIVISDFLSNVTSTVNLVTPVSDGPPLNNIRYADQMSFSPDGKILIYDALSRLRNPDGTYHTAWSIFGIDMATLQQRVIVPTVDEFDIGNPSFSRTSSRYVVFDAQYADGNSTIITLDLYEGALGLIGTSQNGWGYPVFNGNDSKIYFADEDLTTSSRRSIYVQQLAANKLGTSGNRAMAVSDAKHAVIYRRGTYPNINTSPSVMLTSPSSNAVFTSPATVNIVAAPTDIDGTVQRVEFYSGEKLVQTSTASPYAVTLPSVSAGVYTVYARVYDDQGASATSPPLRFTVVPPTLPGRMTTVGAAGFEFSLKLPQAGLYRLEASTNLLDWMSLGSLYCATNLGYMDSSRSNMPQRFYRAVATP